MKAAIYYQPGEPEELHYVTVPDPIAEAGQLLVRVEAISIEGGDLFARRFGASGAAPRIPGYAAAGEVIEIGADVSGFAVGDKVATFGFLGSYAELRAVSAANCWKVPAGLSMAAAASVPIAFGTAALGFSLAGLQAGEALLLQGAGGGVGIAAMQLAREIGARVLGTGRNAASLEMLRDYGLTDAIRVGETSLAEQVKGLVNDGADVLFDNIGGTAFQDGLEAVRSGGRALIVGIAGPGAKTVDSTYLLSRRLSVFGCFLGPIMSASPQREMITDMLDRVASGRLIVPIDREFRLADAAAAHARAEEPGKIGRVIMIP